MALLKAARLRDAPAKAAGGRLPTGSLARPLAWRFDGLFGQKLFEKLQRIGAKRPGNGDELNNVDPPLAALVFGNKGLRPPELRGQRLLANARFMSRCDKNLDKAAVFRGFEGFLH
jgi:hypothetical protein